MDGEKIYTLEYDEKYTEFMNCHFRCVLCNSVLHFKYTKSNSTGEMQEEAFCNYCDIKARTKIFIIH